MKFCQLIECNMRDIFSKNHIQNVMEKLVPDPFLKHLNWACLWINSLRFYTICFYCLPSWGLLKHTEAKLQTTFFYLTLSFLKNKNRSGTSLPVSFSAWFWRKVFPGCKLGSYFRWYRRFPNRWLSCNFPKPIFKTWTK